MERLIFEEETDSVVQKHMETLAIMERKYYILVKHMTKNNKLPKSLMRREWIEDLIQDLLEEEKGGSNKETQSKDLKTWLKNYQVKSKNGRNLLTVKSKNMKTWNTVVPLENSFKTALYAHLETKHGGTYDMVMWLEKSGIAIAQICLPIIRQVCEGVTKECEKNTGKDFKSPLLPLLTQSNDVDSDANTDVLILNAYSEELNTNTGAYLTDANAELGESQETEESEKRKRKTDSQTARKSTTTGKSRKTYVPPVIAKPSIVPAAMVTIIDMSNTPDKMHHFLLVYEDFETGFVQLRPLINADIVPELTMEIFKIFCDFTPPKCICINKEFKSLFEGVLNGLKDIFPSSILLEISEHEVIGDTISLVNIKLKQWHLTFKSDAWSIGCHAVQWEINSKISNDGSTAHRRFFGIKRKNCPEQQKDDSKDISNNVTETSNTFNLDTDSEELNELIFVPNIVQTRNITNLTPHINPIHNISKRFESIPTEESSNIDSIDNNSCPEETIISIDSDDEQPISVKSENGEEYMDVGTLHIEEPVSLKSAHDKEIMDVATIGIKKPLDNLYPISIKPEEAEDIFDSEEKEFDTTNSIIHLSERLNFEPDDETVKSETKEESTDFIFVINRSDVDFLEPKEKDVKNEELHNMEVNLSNNEVSYVAIPGMNGSAAVSNVEKINLVNTPERIIKCFICQNIVAKPMLCQTCKKIIHSFCGGSHVLKGFCCFYCL